MAERSTELIIVGYYLSRFGTSNPPERLGTTKWNDAYRMFYRALHGERTILSFERSLKNTRDDYDGHFPENNRQGWKQPDRNPIKLTGVALEVFNRFSDSDERQIWPIIEEYLDPSYRIKSQIFEDLISEEIANSNDNSRTEGGIKVRISKTVERDPKLRQMALEYHGYGCQVCGFDFEKFYGRWGAEFAEVHHIEPLSSFNGQLRKTNPETDLSVLCANCHRMIHRKKGIILTLEELRTKME